jgi:hypothetical protein
MHPTVHVNGDIYSFNVYYQFVEPEVFPNFSWSFQKVFEWCLEIVFFTCTSSSFQPTICDYPFISHSVPYDFWSFIILLNKPRNI